MEAFITIYITGLVITLALLLCLALAVAITGEDEGKSVLARGFFFAPIWPLLWGYLLFQAIWWIVHWANIPGLLESLKGK